MRLVFVQDEPEAHLLTVVSIPGGMFIVELVATCALSANCTERELRMYYKKALVMFADETIEGRPDIDSCASCSIEVKTAQLW